MAGSATLAPAPTPPPSWLAARWPFCGVGTAFGLDEFGMWLNLRDLCWAREGPGIEAVILGAAGRRGLGRRCFPQTPESGNANRRHPNPDERATPVLGLRFLPPVQRVECHSRCSSESTILSFQAPATICRVVHPSAATCWHGTIHISVTSLGGRIETPIECGYRRSCCSKHGLRQ